MQRARNQCTPTNLAATIPRLRRPVDGSSVAAFRIVFGAILFWEVLRYLPRIAYRYDPDTFHFRYPLFEWVSPWPGEGMYWHFLLMGLAALGLTFGIWHRFSAWLCLLSFGYVFLLEKANYLNHFYMVLLVLFLLTLVRAQASLSWDAWRRSRAVWGQVQAWELYLLRFQIFLVYFYGGVAKLNGDWLRAEPLRHWLARHAEHPWVGFLFAWEWTPWIFSYGGLIFDLSIGFLFLARRTRGLAFAGVIFFNLTNHFLFNIGIFPWVMIGASVLFFEPDAPRRWLEKAFKRLRGDRYFVVSAPCRQPILMAVVALYVIVQILFPFRHWLYPGNVSWTEEGHNFAWHMKLRDKDSIVWFQVEDPETGERFTADLRRHLSPRQVDKMSTRPQMILQYAHFLRDELVGLGLERPVIRAHVVASLNGRPYQYLVDPEVNLAEAEYRLLTPAPWIRPLKSHQPVGRYLTSRVARHQAFEAVVFGRITNFFPEREAPQEDLGGS